VLVRLYRMIEEGLEILTSQQRRGCTRRSLERVVVDRGGRGCCWGKVEIAVRRRW